MAARLVERIFPQWVWRLPVGCKSIALTFDDGPHPDTTPALLAALQQLQIPSTHFVLGSRCQENAPLIEAVRSSGHVIGSHGFDHASLAFKSASYQRETIRRTEDVIVNVLHERPHLFRPPYGHFNPLTSTVLRRVKYTGVMWSLHVHDWAEQSLETLWKRLKNGLHEGAVIVLHDAQPTTDKVIRILPRLADETARRGWSFVTLSSDTFDKLKITAP